MKTMPPFRSINAFTLIELMTVIGVISVLAALLFSAIGPMKSRAADTKCTAKLKLLGSAMTQYLADHNMKFPVADGPANNWVFELLSYVEPVLLPYSKGGGRGPFMCDAALNDQKPNISADSAATYGMNMYLSEIMAPSLSRPSETAVIADGASYGAGWFCGIEAANRRPSLVHASKRAAFVLFADYHIDAMAKIPANAEDRFWKP